MHRILNILLLPFPPSLFSSPSEFSTPPPLLAGAETEHIPPLSCHITAETEHIGRTLLKVLLEGEGGVLGELY